MIKVNYVISKGFDVRSLLVSTSTLSVRFFSTPDHLFYVFSLKIKSPIIEFLSFYFLLPYFTPFSLNHMFLDIVIFISSIVFLQKLIYYLLRKKHMTLFQFSIIISYYECFPHVVINMIAFKFLFNKLEAIFIIFFIIIFMFLFFLLTL